MIQTVLLLVALLLVAGTILALLAHGRRVRAHTARALRGAQLAPHAAALLAAIVLVVVALAIS